MTVPSAQLVLGTMTFGDTVGKDDAARMIDVALGAGIEWIDTANAYVGGETETILGELGVARRDGVRIATKAGMPHADAGDQPPLSAAAIRASVEGSLCRLRADRVDLFYLHQPDRRTPVEETMSAIADLVGEGVIGELGVSNYAAWQIAELGHVAERVGAPRPVVAQQLYNLVARRIEEEYLEFAATTGLATMVYNPLGGGLLSGKHRFEQRPAEGRFGDSRLAGMYTQRYWNADLFAAIGELSEIADGVGVPLSEFALRWLIGRPGVDSLLLGGSKLSHLEANIAAAARGPLPEDALAAADAVGVRLRGPMPAYNR
ncbi:aldo/keto reductase [Microbacterium sp. JZ101]